MSNQPADINSLELMTLREAAVLLFANPAKVKALRTQIRNGKLACVDIAGTFYVTKSQLARMVKKCLVKNFPQGSRSEKMRAFGSSETEPPISAQTAALMTLKKRKKRYRNISGKNGDQTQKKPGNVISISRT